MTSAAIFLDRDGTIIVEKNYLRDPAGVELEVRSAEGLRRMARLNLPLIVVSNQSGVGRGYFSLADAQAVNERLDALLRQEGVVIAGWYLCPHGPEECCACRKPAPGMVEAAARDHDIDPSRSFVIGDKRSDLELASAIGGRGILVTTGQGEADAPWAQENGHAVCRDLLDASAMIDRALGLEA